MSEKSREQALLARFRERMIQDAVPAYASEATAEFLRFGGIDCFIKLCITGVEMYNVSMFTAILHSFLQKSNIVAEAPCLSMFLSTLPCELDADLQHYLNTIRLFLSSTSEVCDSALEQNSRSLAQRLVLNSVNYVSQYSMQYFTLLLKQCGCELIDSCPSFSIFQKVWLLTVSFILKNAPKPPARSRNPWSNDLVGIVLHSQGDVKVTAYISTTAGTYVPSMYKLQLDSIYVFLQFYCMLSSRVSHSQLTDEHPAYETMNTCESGPIVLPMSSCVDATALADQCDTFLRSFYCLVYGYKKLQDAASLTQQHSQTPGLLSVSLPILRDSQVEKLYDLHSLESLDCTTPGRDRRSFADCTSMLLLYKHRFLDFLYLEKLYSGKWKHENDWFDENATTYDSDSTTGLRSKGERNKENGSGVEVTRKCIDGTGGRPGAESGASGRTNDVVAEEETLTDAANESLVEYVGEKRTGKRDRDGKCYWTQEDDMKVIELQAKYGNKWCQIGKEFKPGQKVSGDSIKSHFRCIQKRKNAEKKESQVEAVSVLSNEEMSDLILQHMSAPKQPNEDNASACDVVSKGGNFSGVEAHLLDMFKRYLEHSWWL